MPSGSSKDRRKTRRSKEREGAGITVPGSISNQKFRLLSPGYITTDPSRPEFVLQEPTRQSPMRTGKPKPDTGQPKGPIRRFGFAVLCLIVGIVLFLFQEYQTMVGQAPSWSAALGTLLAVYLLLLLCIWLWDSAANLHWGIRSGLSLAALVILVLAGFRPIRHQYHLEHSALTALGSTPSVPVAAPLTLESLFDTDFPDNFKYKITGTVKFEDGTIVAVKSQEYADFLAGSSFVGFYIPSTPLTFRACVRIGNSVPETLEKIQKSISQDTSYDGGDTITSLNKLSFSGRVFIYDEYSLTLKQKATLVDYYDSKHLAVQFRGIDYLQGMAMARRLQAQQGK